MSMGSGSEVMQPIAVPMIGGMVSSTLLTPVVIPAIHALVKGWRLPKTAGSASSVRTSEIDLRSAEPCRWGAFGTERQVQRFRGGRPVPATSAGNDRGNKCRRSSWGYRDIRSGG